MASIREAFAAGAKKRAAAEPAEDGAPAAGDNAGGAEVAPKKKKLSLEEKFKIQTELEEKIKGMTPEAIRAEPSVLDNLSTVGPPGWIKPGVVARTNAGPQSSAHNVRKIVLVKADDSSALPVQLAYKSGWMKLVSHHKSSADATMVEVPPHKSLGLCALRLCFKLASTPCIHPTSTHLAYSCVLSLTHPPPSLDQQGVLSSTAGY